MYCVQLITILMSFLQLFTISQFYSCLPYKIVFSAVLTSLQLLTLLSFLLSTVAHHKYSTFYSCSPYIWNTSDNQLSQLCVFPWPTEIATARPSRGHYCIYRYENHTPRVCVPSKPGPEVIKLFSCSTQMSMKI